jgi:NADH dehydrogenase
MYLVVGATGFLGSEICRQLAAEGKPVRGLVRATADQAKVDKLKSCGVTLAPGDLRNRASLETVCQGVTAVISTASSMPFSYQPGKNDIQTVDLEGLTNLVRAAQAAGVEHFIYTSFTMENDFPLRNAKRAVEGRLKESRLTYTILRPSYFMEIWLSPAVGFDAANAKAQIYGSGENPISWISLRDVAQFAVASLNNPAARNATLELGGPEALSPLQVVQIFEKVGGQAFKIEHVPEEALKEQQQAATDPMAQSFAALMHCYAQGDPIDMQETLKVFPVQLTSVKAYAERILVPA